MNSIYELHRSIEKATKAGDPKAGRLVEKAWDELSDVPFDEDDGGYLRLESDWGLFAAGTDREEIWHWFDDHHPAGVHALMFPSEPEKPSAGERVIEGS